LAQNFNLEKENEKKNDKFIHQSIPMEEYINLFDRVMQNVNKSKEERVEKERI
jgi:hypothetical protein